MLRSVFFNFLSLTLATFVFVNLSFSQQLRLSDNFCGQTVNSIGTNINCNVNRGQGHRYEVTRMDGTVVGVYDAISASAQSPSRSRYLFRFSFVTGFPWSFNASYRVRVSLFDGVNWSEYGPYCQVNSPSSILRVNETFCGSQVSSMGVNITTNANHMSGHRFEVRETSGDLVGVYDGISANELSSGRSAYVFRFSWMPVGSIAESRTYGIRVAHFDGVSGVWSDYGPSCNVKTPGLPATNLTDDFCGNLNIDSTDKRISGVPVDGAVSYLFDFQIGNESIGQIESDNATVDMDQLPGAHPYAGQVYTVSVATKSSTSYGYGDFGMGCNVAISGYTTTIQSDFCGKEYNYLIEDTIYAITIPEAEAYRFRITDGDFTSIDTCATPSADGSITLFKFPGIDYCRDYQMSVSVLVNGVWGPFGESCTISSVCHPVTKLRICNDTIYSCMTNLFSRTIPLSEGVQFLVTGDGFSEILDASAHNRIKFTDLVNLSRIRYESNYQVQCRILLNGVWGQWGEVCNVYLQTNSKISNFCDATVPSMSSNISATSVGCANDYRFLVNGPGVENRTVNHASFSNFFRFNIVPGVQMGSSYSVRVSVLVNGQWSPYGEECFVSTPMPTKSGQFESTLSEVSIYPNPSNEMFNVLLEENIENGLYEIHNLSGQLVEKGSFNGVSFIVGNDLREGVYLMTIYDNNKIHSKERIVKIN